MFKLAISLSNMFSSKKHNKLPPIAEPLLLRPAHELSKQIKDGSLTSLRLCELLIERVKQVQPHINAMTQDRFDEALEAARRVDALLARFRAEAGSERLSFEPHELEMLNAPLLGVPVSVKESIMVKGMRNSCGLWSRRNELAAHDAVVVANLSRLGMIPFCTTNIPECTMYWADCQNKVYGRTVNPYDFNRITGASSGGEGALLASGGSLCGIGSDIGGSLRLPAQFCGINSHKPSPFLVSSEGNWPEVKLHRLRMFSIGPMARYVSDLRPMLKCLLSDKDNPKQDSYLQHQPSNIGQLRQTVVKALDEPCDLSKLTVHYFKFNESSQLKGKQSVHVQPDIADAQDELIDHFRSKFSCQTQHIDLDKYLKKILITWQCMLSGGGVRERDSDFSDDELSKTIGIENMALEMLKMPFGLSKHTKESLLAVSLGRAIPKGRADAYELCERFEKLAAELKSDIEAVLGDNGVLIMPTMPAVAYKHNVSLLRTKDMRFTALFNVIQLPVTHVTMRLDKKHGLPFGFSVAAKPYRDWLTLAVAEEVELTFGGWVPPPGQAATNDSTTKTCATTKNLVANQQKPPTTITTPAIPAAPEPMPVVQAATSVKSA